MKHNDAPIVIDSDTEDEDVPEQPSAKRAKTSVRAHDDDNDDDIVEVAKGGASQEATQTAAPPTLVAPPLGLGGISSIDRAAMEKARRDRHKQRRKDAGLPSEDEDDNNSSNGNQPTSGPSKIPTSNTSAALNGGLGPSSSSSSRVTATSGIGRQSKPALRRILAGERFWDGAVKRSFNVHTGDGVHLSDFLLPTTRSNAHGLEAAIVSSYDWDEEGWLEAMMPTAASAVPGREAPQITFVRKEERGPGHGRRAGIHQMDEAGWTTLRVKERGPRDQNNHDLGKMHIKMLLLVYGDRLRLVVSTGNLTPTDWGHLENAAWVQDFPLLSAAAASPSPSSQERARDVLEQLELVLAGLDVPTAHPVFRSLARYDFSAGPILVASIPPPGPGGYRGVNVRRYGLGRLAEKAQEMMGDGTFVDVEAQMSSMGDYKQRWLQQFHLVAAGRASPSSSNAVVLPGSGTTRDRTYLRAAVMDGDGGGGEKAAWTPIKILFPTQRFVVNRSVMGADGGGCHFGRQKKFEDWLHLCRQPEAERHGGLLMHHKAVLVLKKGVEGIEGGGASSGSVSDDERVGYVVLTSANFGMAAWGNLSKKDDGTQLSLNNWELGVLLPLRRADLRPEACLTTNARSAIPWRRPAKRYGERDVPWSPFNPL